MASWPMVTLTLLCHASFQVPQRVNLQHRTSESVPSSKSPLRWLTGTSMTAWLTCWIRRRAPLTTTFSGTIFSSLIKSFSSKLPTICGVSLNSLTDVRLSTVILRRTSCLFFQLRPSSVFRRESARRPSLPGRRTNRCRLDIRRPYVDDRIARPRKADVDRLGHIRRNILRIEVFNGNRDGITSLTERILFVDDDEPQDDSQEKADDFKLPIFINLVHVRPPFKDIRQALRCPGQEGFQHIAQGIAVKMAINVAAVGIRNGSRFFTDDDDDGIGQLADADSRPVPRPQFRRQGPIGGQRKEAAGCIIRFSRIMTAPS